MGRALALLILLAGATGAASVVGASPRATSTIPQADSAQFTLNFPGRDAHPEIVGDVLYCGVAEKAEPFELSVAVSNPPLIDDTTDPPTLLRSGYESVGWLSVMLQTGAEFGGPFGPTGTRRPEFLVPSNGSWSFALTLGGRPGEDQIVQVTSLPLGDFDGGGEPMYGYATVRANPGAVDPFEGDGRTDNYCLTIGIPGAGKGGSWEYIEGEISTALPVPDDWVVDGDGADGGILRGFPH